MKKTLFLLFIFNCLFINEISGQLITDVRYNKRYTKVRITTPQTDKTEGNYEPEKVLKIVPPLWKTQVDTIYNDSFPKENTQSILYKEYALTWQWGERIPSNCLRSKREDCLYFVTKKIKSEKKEIHFTSQDSFKIIKTQKRVKHGTLEWVKEEFPEFEFDENQAFKVIKTDDNRINYIKVKAGKWTEWQESPCRSINPDIIVYQLQFALKEHGYYNGPLDNRFNNELRAAITKFQRDNNLPICGLIDFPITSLVRYLGIEY